jgi:hypothetical protein
MGENRISDSQIENDVRQTTDASGINEFSKSSAQRIRQKAEGQNSISFLGLKAYGSLAVVIALFVLAAYFIYSANIH